METKVTRAWVASVGGGEDATFLELDNGHVLVVAFGHVGTYTSEDAYWEGSPLSLVELK